MGYLKTCTSQSKQNALLNIRAIPLHFGENYLSWYHNEQIYPLKEYFLETFYYLCSQTPFRDGKIFYTSDKSCLSNKTNR